MIGRGTLGERSRDREIRGESVMRRSALEEIAITEIAGLGIVKDSTRSRRGVFLVPSTQRDAPTTMEISALWSIGAAKIKRVTLSPA